MAEHRFLVLSMPPPSPWRHRGRLVL